MLTIFKDQPRAFYMVFMLEIWERFGYYTIQGIIVLYFIRALGFSESEAYYTFGSFFALVYGIIALGGFIGDRILGTKRAIIYGLIVLACGYLALAMVNKEHVFFALGLVCVGNGLFKANPASLMAKSYDKQDKRLDSGVTLYYMAINLGAIFALFIGPFLVAHFGYPYAYGASFLGMIFALLNYWYQHNAIKSIRSTADDRKIETWQWACLIFATLLLTCIAAYLLQHIATAKLLIRIVSGVVVACFFYCMRNESKESRLKMLLAFILMLEAVVFFTLYHQMPTSINLFAVNNVQPYLFGIHMDPQSFQALNPIWIITMSPLLALFYKSLQSRNILFSIPYKFALGMTFCGLSFGILYLSRFMHDDMGLVSSWWLVASYFFQSLGELLVSALGIALVSELVPRHISGFVMGMWFLTSSVAGFLGAFVASYTAMPNNLQSGIDSLNRYTQVFAHICLITLIVALLLWLISPYLNRLRGVSHTLPSKEKIEAV